MSKICPSWSSNQVRPLGSLLCYPLHHRDLTTRGETQVQNHNKELMLLTVIDAVIRTTSEFFSSYLWRVFSCVYVCVSLFLCVSVRVKG